jgi:GntR family transcriptional regulator
VRLSLAPPSLVAAAGRPGVPVFRVPRTVYDSEDRSVEAQDTVAAADRHTFRYEVDMR